LGWLGSNWTGSDRDVAWEVLSARLAGVQVVLPLHCSKSNACASVRVRVNYIWLAFWQSCPSKLNYKFFARQHLAKVVFVFACAISHTWPESSAELGNFLFIPLWQKLPAISGSFVLPENSTLKYLLLNWFVKGLPAFIENIYNPLFLELVLFSQLFLPMHW